MAWPSRIKIGKGRFCSTRCGKMGKNSWNWKGGMKASQGYIKILTPDHPHADLKGYVPEHRLNVESFIGRYLSPEEVVHHKDGNRSNNDITNLELVSSQSEHMKRHRVKGVRHYVKT